MELPTPRPVVRTQTRLVLSCAVTVLRYTSKDAELVIVLPILVIAENNRLIGLYIGCRKTTGVRNWTVVNL